MPVEITLYIESAQMENEEVEQELIRVADAEGYTADAWIQNNGTGQPVLSLDIATGITQEQVDNLKREVHSGFQNHGIEVDFTETRFIFGEDTEVTEQEEQPV